MLDGLDIVDEPDPNEFIKYEAIPESMMEPETASSSRDPIRMYLSQMGHIPLLSREKEIFLAKQIEVARKWFQQQNRRNRTLPLGWLSKRSKRSAATNCRSNELFEPAKRKICGRNRSRDASRSICRRLSDC